MIAPERTRVQAPAPPKDRVDTGTTAPLTLAVDRVSDVAGLVGLRAEWNELLARTETNEIALTWEWLSTWWAVFDDASRRLLVLTLREGRGRRLVGLAPLQLRKVTVSPLLPAVRRVEFLASGEDDADAICSDYLNVLAERGREGEVASALAAYLCHEPAREWDELYLTAMDATAPGTAALATALHDAGLAPEWLPFDRCPYLRLPASWDALMVTLDARTRAEVRRAERRLGERGQIELRRAESLPELAEHFATLVDLHRRRRAAKGTTGAFESAAFTAFHRRFLPLALDNGWLDLRTLCVGGRHIAARYCLRHAGRVQYYQGGMDSDAAPGASIGLLMDAYCIREAIRDGASEYDFLRGVEAYKRRWTQDSRELVTLRVESGRPRSVALARGVGRQLRALRGWLPTRPATGTPDT